MAMPFGILGGAFIRLEGKSSSGQIIRIAEMVYVSSSTSNFYLSREAMERLGIINSPFPKVGATSISGLSEETASCDCPTRQKAPPRPESLPFEPVEENIQAMKEWLLHRYSASTFNKCPHQEMPFMRDDPHMEVFIDKSVKPHAVHTPVVIPIHWREQAKEGLDRDCQLGAIEKVPPNTPVTWCHRAIWTSKPDGSPRRVVDMQSLNKHCVRDTHHVLPPFQQARLVPPRTWRSVTDAWKGYHSVPIREEDKHLFTFITEFGR